MWIIYQHSVQLEIAGRLNNKFDSYNNLNTPYRKPFNKPIHIDKQSNHSPNVTKIHRKYQILHQAKIYLVNQFQLTKTHCVRVVLKRS